jgi:hypothetical protein
MLFSDLDDGNGEVYGLGLVGSGCVMDVYLTFFCNPEVTDYVCLSVCLTVCL